MIQIVPSASDHSSGALSVILAMQLAESEIPIMLEVDLVDPPPRWVHAAIPGKAARRAGKSPVAAAARGRRPAQG